TAADHLLVTVYKNVRRNSVYAIQLCYGLIPPFQARHLWPAEFPVCECPAPLGSILIQRHPNDFEPDAAEIVVGCTQGFLLLHTGFTPACPECEKQQALACQQAVHRQGIALRRGRREVGCRRSGWGCRLYGVELLANFPAKRSISHLWI